MTKERPILFSAPMVRAILAGTKTQTRRVAPVESIDILDIGDGTISWAAKFSEPVRSRVSGGRATGTYSGGRFTRDQAVSIIAADFCPYGRPGDRLWVRETFWSWGRWETRYSERKGRDEWHFVDMTLEAGRSYQFDIPAGWQKNRRSSVTPNWWKRPAIHMPRVASRILLEITGVRVERLQACSEADALAEGIVQLHNQGFGLPAGEHYHSADPRQSYFSLWEAINGPGSVEANPWVWVVEFARIAG